MQIGRARRATVTVAALIVIVIIAVGGGAAAGVGPSSIGDASSVGDAPGTADDVNVFAPENADQVSLVVDIDESGDATWTVKYRVELDTDEREQAFSDLEGDIEENPDEYRNRFRERMERTADTAADATGRDMGVQNVRVRTERRELPESYGVVIYEFQWTNFAVVDGDRIEIGDAIAGYFLEEGHSLKITWPDEYELQSVSPSPDSRDDATVTWTGPVDFGNDSPRITASAGSSPVPGVPLSGLGVVGIGALVAITGALYWRREIAATLVGDGSDGSAGAETPKAADRAAGTDDPESREPDGSEAAQGSPSPVSPETSASGTSAGATPVDSGSEELKREVAVSESAGDGDEPPEELLSNEERVLKLIRENGGRMKQQDVVQQLDWTEARTSQIVTGLRDDGELESFRLGRENVLRLPEADDDDQL